MSESDPLTSHLVKCRGFHYRIPIRSSMSVTLIIGNTEKNVWLLGANSLSLTNQNNKDTYVLSDFLYYHEFMILGLTI